MPWYATFDDSYNWAEQTSNNESCKRAHDVSEIPHLAMYSVDQNNSTFKMVAENAKMEVAASVASVEGGWSRESQIELF